MGTLGTCPEPRVFFLFEGPQLAVVNFFKTILLPSQRLTVKRKLGKYFLARGPVRLGVPRAPMQVKRRYCNFWLCPCWKRNGMVCAIWQDSGAVDDTVQHQRFVNSRNSLNRNVCGQCGVHQPEGIRRVGLSASEVSTLYGAIHRMK